MSKPDAPKYEVPFTFVREPDADMHTCEDKPYYLQQHYSNGLLLSSVGRFCDSCGYFVVLEGNVFIGNGVKFKVEGDKITVFDEEGKQLPVYTPDQSIAAGDFGVWGSTDLDTATIYAGTSITVKAAYSADRTNNWSGVVAQISNATEGMYLISADGAAKIVGSWATTGNYGTTVITRPTIAEGQIDKIKTAKSVELTLSLDGETDTMTIVYNCYDKDGREVSTLTWTITGMTAESYVLGFANDGATIDGNVTISMGGLNA